MVNAFAYLSNNMGMHPQFDIMKKNGLLFEKRLLEAFNRLLTSHNKIIFGLVTSIKGTIIL